MRPRGERRPGLVPRVARGCQPQDNNFIIGGITPARRGTVRVRGVGGSTDIVSIRTNGAAISSPAVSPGPEPWVRYGRIIIESLYPLSKYHGAGAHGRIIRLRASAPARGLLVKNIMSTLSREPIGPRCAHPGRGTVSRRFCRGTARLTHDPRAPSVILRGETINPTLSRGTLSSMENGAL